LKDQELILLQRERNLCKTERAIYKYSGISRNSPEDILQKKVMVYQVKHGNSCLIFFILNLRRAIQYLLVGPSPMAFLTNMENLPHLT
jgi:hypothetical protein